jgi:hypothetical protein
MATATATKAISFKVTCPKCHSGEPTIVIDLNDLALIRCNDCDELFTAREACEAFAREAARWEAVAQWVEMAQGLAQSLGPSC